MMTVVLHALAGTALAPGIFLLFSRLAGETRFPLPLALVVHGAAAVMEYRRDCRAQRLIPCAPRAPTLATPPGVPA